MKIGVFDSGVGGLSVANAIQAALPDHEVVFVNDTEHVPYGTKSSEEIYGYVVPIIQDLVDANCDAIVIACNTVSTNLIQQLREDFSTIPLVAMEPMVKPAAEQTKSKVIAICATPATLASQRYNHLKQQYAEGITVLEPDCSDWSFLIEHNQMNNTKISEQIEPVLAHGADMIVLGCTHYHWIEEEIKQLAGKRAVVLQPEGPLITQLQRVLGLAV